jgi:integrase
MGEQLCELSSRGGEVSTEFLPERPDLSDRGAVHTFNPSYTVPGPDGKRITKVAKTWAWRFEFRGKRYQGADGYPTAKAARDAGETRKAEVRAGLEEDWRHVQMLRLHQMASARKVEWDQASQRVFDSDWKRIYMFFKPQDNLIAIDDTRLLEFVGFLKNEGYASSTIHQTLVKLKTAMRIAHEKKLLPWIPRFPKLKVLPREQTVAPVELEQILAKMPSYYALFFQAASEMGWRANSELRTRQWCHVDWGPQQWTCPCGKPVTSDVCLTCGAGRPGWVELDAASSKTDTARSFPMSVRLRSILNASRANVEALQATHGRIIPWVFVRDDARPIGDYRSAWAAALEALGIGKLPGRTGPWSAGKVPHDIRRTAIRRMHRQGLDRQSVKALVGHSTESSHQLYSEKTASPEQLREAALRIDQARAAERPEEKVTQLQLWRK